MATRSLHFVLAAVVGAAGFADAQEKNSNHPGKPREEKIAAPPSAAKETGNPSERARSKSEVHSGASGDFDLTTVPVDAAKPLAHAFVPTDVRSWTELGRRLEILGQANLLPTAGVWHALGDDAKAAVRTLAEGKGGEKERNRVLAALNSLITQRSLPSALGYRPSQIRDLEALSLFNRFDSLSDGDLQRLNRLLLESAFPFELFQARADAQKIVSLYPPAASPITVPPPVAEANERTGKTPPKEVTLQLNIPRLRGRMAVMFETGEDLFFAGEGKRKLTVKNTGEVKYRIVGDDDQVRYPRSLRWTPEKVGSDGALEEPLKLLAE